jgi:hypothetical protein
LPRGEADGAVGAAGTTHEIAVETGAAFDADGRIDVAAVADTSDYRENALSDEALRSDSFEYAAAAAENAVSEELAHAGEFADNAVPEDFVSAGEFAEDVENVENDTNPAPEDEMEGKGHSEPRGEFSWNIHRFPSMEARKTEDVDFDWSMSPSSFSSKSNSGNLRNADGRSFRPKTIDELFASCENREPAAPEEGAESKAAGALESGESESRAPKESGDFAAPAARDEPVAPAMEEGVFIAAAADIFGRSPGSSAETQGYERFFTFDQKNAEFQKLLDREYERLQAYNSPIVNEAREMLAKWDWPGFEDKRTDPATKRWDPLALREAAERETPRDAGAPETPEEAASAGEESAAEATPQAAAAFAPEELASPAPPEERTTGEPAAPVESAGESAPAVEPVSAETPAPAVEPAEAPAPETAAEALAPEEHAAEEPATAPPAYATPPEEPVSAEAPAPAVEPTEAPAPEEHAAEEPASAPFAPITEPAEALAPGETATEALAPEETAAEAPAPPAVTEAELSIGKALDSIEKEIEDWKNREKLSTASKVAVILSVIFLLFTGGAAAVKHFAPHSPVDVWFDSVQLQAAATIKHGVDAIRDIFDDSDDEAAGSEAETENGDGESDGDI